MPQKLKLISLMPILLVCFGLVPMVQAVGPDTDGSIPGGNNGEGVGVLVSRTTGIWNTGTGFEALNSLTAGNQNTATGVRALFSDINGGFNTATGVYSLYSNTAGFYNSATGAYSLANNTIGNYNTANGYSTLYFNTEGEQNAANGFGALYKNTTGDQNNAFGNLALNENVVGAQNTAIGDNALQHSLGNRNTAVGNEAGTAVTTGSNNVYLGDNAGSSFNHVNESNTMRLGSDTAFPGLDPTRCFIAGIVGNGPFGGDVSIDVVTHQLGVGVSSARFKKDIDPMDKTSEAIFSLRPVTFHYKNDTTNTSQFGLIAEEVAKVNPALIAVDKEGKPYSVRYSQINAMLLNEFLKEHKKVEEQQASIAELKSTVAQQQKGMEVLTAQLEEQAAQIQKVSAQLETSKPATKVVVNTP